MSKPNVKVYDWEEFEEGMLKNNEKKLIKF
jgi:hypothetical protein